LYSSLPKNEKSFDIDMHGDVTGLHYKGTFTARCVLSIASRHAMELEKTRLMADYANPSNGLAGIAIALSSIRAKIVEGPAWWKDSDGGANLLDENVIFRLYDECNKLEAAWRKELKKDGEEAQKGNAQPES
jgi:hypothetical protein